MQLKIIISIILACLVLAQFLLNIRSITKINKQILGAFNRGVTTNKSPWEEYRNSWRGEVLINIKTEKKNIQFTEEYRYKMREKGPHPLTIKHTRLLERAMIVEEYCQVIPPNKGIYNMGAGYYSVLFNDKLELLQCVVQKVSSSTWVDMFIKMLGEKLQTRTTFIQKSDAIWNNISLVYNLEPNITAKRYQTYTKFLITRNPFERLLSAYRSKFTQGQKWYEETVGPEIIKENYLSNIPYDNITEVQRELREGRASLTSNLSNSEIAQIMRLEAGVGGFNITFLEFLNYVISFSVRHGRERLDHHWAPATTICNPCAVKYDILAKFETLNEDSQAILDYVQARYSGELIRFPQRQPNANPNECRKEFMKIPIEVRYMLYQIYKEDFIIFGYKHNEVKMWFC